MTEQQSREAGKVSSVARRFRREGYAVLEPKPGDRLPDFLDGFVPDLIAERADDHVVVEVKSAAALRGDNQLKALAALVEGQPGWRFELITISEPVEPPTGDMVSDVAQIAGETFKMGQKEAALILALALAEDLVRDIALQSGARGRDWSASRLAHKLVTSGIMDPLQYEAFASAQQWRHRFVHGRTSDEKLDRPQLDRVVALCEALRATAASLSQDAALGRAA